jgi:hypothetical protein
MKINCLVAVSVVALAFAGASAMSGKAVTSVSYFDPAGWPNMWTSRMIAVTVANNVVTKVDTIIPAGSRGTVMTSVTISPDGSRFAFFKSGAGLCVANIDGSNLRTITSGGAISLGLPFISWTSVDNGKALYFHKGSGEIWKVNVDDPAQITKVCDYTKGPGANLMNFTLSTGARYCVIRALGSPLEDIGYQGGGWAHTFPPEVNPATGWIDPALTQARGSDIQNECNQGVSVSGKLFWHFSGQHTSLYGDLWNHATNSATQCSPHALFNMYSGVETWLKASPVMTARDIGDYLFAPRGSSNSDNVIIILATYGMVQYNTDGANMLIVNWKNSEAVMVTSNPDQRAASNKWTAEPGDFHLDGGPANSYQQLDGSWTPFPGATSVAHGVDNARAAVRTRIASGRAAVYNCRGARVSALDAGSSAPHHANLRGVYVVADKGAAQKAMILFWALAWPGVDGGKYLYYHKTCDGGENECYYSCSGEIWKVNVDDTAQKTFVCDFTKSNKQIAGDNGLPYFARFQMSADAKYAAIHAGGGSSLNVWGYANGCIPFTFPPKTNPGTTQINPALTQPSCDDNNCLGYQGACNAALSTSGAIFYHFGGAHVCLYAHYWNHTTNSLSGTYTVGTGPANSLDMGLDIESWLSTGPANSMGGALNWPRGTSNSDRVVTVLTPWIYTSSYAQMGCNMVVADWKDKKAAMVTYCPKPQLAGPDHNYGWAIEGTRWWFAEPGDFWVSGGPDGCYQAIDGSWINISRTSDSCRQSSSHCACHQASDDGPGDFRFARNANQWRSRKINKWRSESRRGHYSHRSQRHCEEQSHDARQR